MASIIGAPVLSIGGAPGRPGFSIVKVSWKVAFDGFDQAANQPYTYVVRLIGDDTGVGDPAAAGPDDTLALLAAGITSAGNPAVPSKALSHSVVLSNMTLNEDKGAIPNPDEIRATVKLTPNLPAAVGPKESNLVALAL